MIPRVIPEFAHVVGKRWLCTSYAHIISSAAMIKSVPSVPSVPSVFSEVFIKTGTPWHFQMMNPPLATGPAVE